MKGKKSRGVTVVSHHGSHEMSSVAVTTVVTNNVMHRGEETPTAMGYAVQDEADVNNKL